MGFSVFDMFDMGFGFIHDFENHFCEIDVGHFDSCGDVVDVTWNAIMEY